MILVSGARGRLARIVIEQLNEPVVGMDVRDAPPDFPGQFFRLKRYKHRKTAEVFRKVQPRVLLHLGVRSASPRMDQRYTENVLGTQHLLRLCQKFGVERVAMDNVAFDANLAEAVGVVPIQDPALDGVVLATESPAYRLGDAVIRPGRVVVGQLPDA